MKMDYEEIEHITFGYTFTFKNGSCIYIETPNKMAYIKDARNYFYYTIKSIKFFKNPDEIVFYKNSDEKGWLEYLMKFPFSDFPDDMIESYDINDEETIKKYVGYIFDNF